MARVARANLSAARLLDAQRLRRRQRPAATLGACLDDLPEVRAALAGHYAAVARERRPTAGRAPRTSLSAARRVRVFTAMPVRDGGGVVGVVRMSRTEQQPARGGVGRSRYTVLPALLRVWLLMHGGERASSRARISRPVQAITARGRGDRARRAAAPFAPTRPRARRGARRSAPRSSA